MSNKPFIITLLGERVKNWSYYDNYVMIELENSPLDSLLFDTSGVPLSLGDVNMILIGVKKGVTLTGEAELVWKGFIKRSAKFDGTLASILNSNDYVMELVNLIEPVSIEVSVKASEERNDAVINLSLLHVASPNDKTIVNGAVKLIEKISDILAEPTRRNRHI
ncbi:MAG: hypothetical protein ACP5TI_05000 [Thermoprotei archaeon]